VRKFDGQDGELWDSGIGGKCVKELGVNDSTIEGTCRLVARFSLRLELLPGILFS
jgi:hypothetical protein